MHWYITDRMQSPSPTPNMDDSPLGQLPAEIRNKIYHLVLVHDTPVNICKRSGNSSTRTRNRNRHVSLAAFLQTCRQVRNEAAAIFYKLNTILFVDDYLGLTTYRRLAAWLFVLGPDVEGLVRRIRLGPPSRRAKQDLEECRAHLLSERVEADNLELVLGNSKGKDITDRAEVEGVQSIK